MTIPIFVCITIGIILLGWPTIQRLVFPDFRSGIPWERMIWGYRPGVLPRLLGVVSIIVGLGWLLLWNTPPHYMDQALSDAGLEKQVRLELWIWRGLLGAMVLVVLLSRRLSNFQDMTQRWMTYFRRLSPRKRILIIVLPIAAYLLILGANLFVNFATRSFWPPR